MELDGRGNDMPWHGRLMRVKIMETMPTHTCLPGTPLFSQGSSCRPLFPRGCVVPAHLPPHTHPPTSLSEGSGEVLPPHLVVMESCLSLPHLKKRRGRAVASAACLCSFWVSGKRKRQKEKWLHIWRRNWHTPLPQKAGSGWVLDSGISARLCVFGKAGF